uniref:Zinc finger CCCH domain-containing protein 14 n=1 Tax=Xenopus tropicalis TaxID=8364 RepID=A0A6I8S7H4_XENTR
MEIGTEISRKIRTAIKGKLQELGAYVDEELPDYIMVMVANKKSQKQMTEDLSLFLGSNTSRFTTWLQGVLDKLRSVTPESNSMKSSDAIIFESSMPSLKSLSNSREDLVKDGPALTVSSTRHERYDSSSSSHGQATLGSSGSVARLTSAVKPLRELSPSEAVIDIKLDLDDPFNEDISYATETAIMSRKRAALSASYRTLRPTAEVYRPPGSGQHAYHTNEYSSSLHRFPQNSFISGKSLNLQGSRTVGSTRVQDLKDVSDLTETYQTAYHLASEKSLREEELSRKRRLPVASSVVKVKKLAIDGEEEEEEGEEDEDEEGGDCISRTAGISSSVSVPARPERRPSLPPSKQANKNLILKAISEAQDSVTKTTNYSTAETVHKMDLLSRLQPNLEEEIEMQNPEAEILRPVDSRSFILKRPKLSKEPSEQIQNNSVSPACPSQPLPGRMIQPREAQTCEKPASPKFIVTLDGVPSPPGYISDQEVEEPICYTEEGDTCAEQLSAVARPEQNYPVQLATEALCTNDVVMETAKEKIRERCKYWPACKNADSCAYHHPTAPCKSFPNCRFADKCFFIHPNCKYDAKCTKADCPFTHASKRFPVPPVKPVSTTSSSSHPSCQPCRYFPACKKTDCPFYHPKHCRFNTQCTRPNCKFYHPSVSVPPRHALTWTRAQASD